jgi:membrane protein YqaA with SNARE-associated domain
MALAAAYGVFFASAVLPWLNAEVLLLSMMPLVRSWNEAALLVLIATAGQISGKVAIYWLARAAWREEAWRGRGRDRFTIDRWRKHLTRRPASAASLLFPREKGSGVDVAIPATFWPDLATKVAGMATSTPDPFRTTPVYPALMDPLTAPMTGTERRDIGGAQVDIVKTGAARIRRIIYPPGFRWSTNVKPVAGTDWCLHAHLGFLARGRIQGRYHDGCTFEFTAPQALVIEPDHDAWVVGEEPAVLIEFDFERDTVQRLGLRERHGH